MNAIAKPILDRVEDFMREKRDSVAMEEVIAAFPGETANVVRLTLGALRRQGKLVASVEYGKSVYSYVAETSRAADARPLRKEEPKLTRLTSPTSAPTPGPTPKPTPAPKASEDESIREKLLSRMQPGRIYSMPELGELVEKTKHSVRKAVYPLLESKRIIARGETQARRYWLPGTEPPPLKGDRKVTSGSPSFAQVEPRPTPSPGPTPGPAEPADVMATIPTLATAPVAAPQDPPRFAYWSDGSLQIDCAECSGKLYRRDLEALRVFLNDVPTLKGE